ncbi:MAG TPA: adenylate/guanylate cyclase domain-containing protein [Acidimicrobiia bacterium]|nr:adenylate/guanylate cyclase domain-containing protein [Acidimicrobiia bacterium]
MNATTRYARLGDDHVAYQVVGEGSLDVVFVPEWASHLELQWEDPLCARFLERLAAFARLICFDKRGIGLSDPLPPGAGEGLDPWMEDVTAVLDAVGSHSAAMIGTGAGGPMTLLYAASHPDRTQSLVLCNTAARFVQADDYPIGIPPELVPEGLAFTRESWGTAALFDDGAPSLAGSEAARTFHARVQRQAASPGVAAAMQSVLLATDVRGVLPAVHMPTLVVHRSRDRLVDVAHGRYLAAHIDNAKYVELDDDNHLYYAGDADALLAEIQSFLTGRPAERTPDRVLATVLFTDIVGSTGRASDMGDRRWRELLDRHDAATRRQLARFRGREIKAAGDGFVATFDGPARALRCACAIRDAVRALGLDVRIGVHTGEVEMRGEDISGIGVHIGARVGAQAQAGEVLLTRTVADLVAGSGIEFADRGSTELRGVPGEWQLVAVAGA